MTCADTNNRPLALPGLTPLGACRWPPCDKDKPTPARVGFSSGTFDRSGIRNLLVRNLNPRVANEPAVFHLQWNTAELSSAEPRSGAEPLSGQLSLAPPRKLVGWVGVQLEPGETRQVVVTLAPQSRERPLSYWSADAQEWEIAKGEYPVYVGASSRDIRLTGTFCI